MADLSSLLGAVGVGGAIGKAIVSLELDTAKYQAELEAANAQTAASTQAMGQSTSKLAGLAQAAFLGAGVAVAAGIAVAIKAGSDLNEQINKSKEVFEDAAGEAEAFSKTTATGLGIARSAALEAQSNFGLLMEAAGFAADSAQEMSQKMVTLGADLGSFNNIPVAQALEKIRAGLAGEAEPLRQLGVFLSEARVQTEAYSSGIAKQGEELTEAQKIQARYNIILDDTAKAQGDFQRTVGESVPNQLKVLQASLTDTAAELGVALLPIVLNVTKAITAMLPVIEGLVTGFIQLGHWVVVATEKVGAFYDAISRGIPVTDEMIDVMGKAAHPFLETADAADETGDAVEGAGIQIQRFANMTEEELKDWKAGFTAAIEDVVFSLQDLSTESGITAHDVIDAHREMLRTAREMASAMRDISREKWINDEYIVFLSEQAPEWLSAFADLNERQQRRMQDQWLASRDKVEAFNDRLDDATSGLDRLDQKETKHKVTIVYDYVGFDPTKPGMGGAPIARKS